MARRLAPAVVGSTIRDVTWTWDRTIRHPQPPQRFAVELRGATIRGVGRRAKSVLLHLADGRVVSIALRMTGALLVQPAGSAADPHARVVFHLADGRELRFRDVRKFGRVGLWAAGGGRRHAVAAAHRARGRLVAEAAEPYRIGDLFASHGPEPLAGSFTARRLAGLLRARRGRLKTLLLNQAFVAGIGNIYADEALWRARLHPLRSAATLQAHEVERLHRSIRAVLRTGIRYGGATLRDFIAPDGGRGGSQERFQVYRRTGEPCPRCGTPIERIVVGQRSTHLCPRCQLLEPPHGVEADRAAR